MDRKSHTRHSLPRAAHRAAGICALLGALTLAGCGGGSGAPTVENPPTQLPDSTEYKGPPPATSDIQSFKTEFFDNVRPTNRCGQCHGAGGQAPGFARSDDVNLAYEAANAIVDLPEPEQSRVVTKVGNGHNCWRDNDGACAEDLRTWIERWAGVTADGGDRAIELTAPVIRDVGNSKSFPPTPDLFASTVYPLLTTYCAECHAPSSTFPQSPFLAAAEVDAAYDSVKARINLDTPADSRLVLRLGKEFHNCWSDCNADAAEMQAAIETFAGQVPETEVDPALVVSKALRLGDGVVAAGGKRYEANVIALYEFKTGRGTVAFDTSGVAPPLDLTLSGDVGWIGGWGIEIRGGKAQGSTTASRKLHDLIKSTGAYAIEAWVVPGNVTQEEAHIISYSAGPMARNFTLGQTLYQYDFFNRSSTTDGNGGPALSTAADDEDLQATLQHVVVNFDPIEGRSVYVNGTFTDDEDDVEAGSLVDWDDTFAFVLGNEVSSDRQWLGTLRMVAIHNRTLTPEQIVQNFEAGVGEKFFLLFSVSELVDLPQSYILFEVSQFDNYAYLFNQPSFISLDPDVRPTDIPLRGMRIGVNGKEASVGQAYATLDTRLEEARYDAAGQPLSRLGTVIARDKGPESDEFFLTFERIGQFTDVRTPPAVLAPAAVDLEPRPDIGIRTFDEINLTMAAVTGVSTQQADVKATFDTVRQQLPTKEIIEGFVSAHQIAVAQLSIEYCNALVEDPSLRGDMFGAFDFDAPAGSAFDSQGERDQIFDPLITRLMNSSLASQPDPAIVKGELASLTDTLTACGGGCPADQTRTVVKAVCAASIGNAAMLLQ